MMIGELNPPASGGRSETAACEPRLTIRRLRADGDLGQSGLDIDQLDVHPGEILGVAGVAGNGQTMLVEVLAGQRKPAAGEIIVSGARYHAVRAEAQVCKVRVLPEEPLRNGCVASMSVRDNINLRRFDRDASGRHRFWLHADDMAQWARRAITAFSIKTPSDEAPMAVLSGGNVQRAVLARELDGEVDLLVVSNPCFGLDVKAVAEIRSRIMAARNSGTAVLLFSEDLDEILELSDRIVVMRQGVLVYETLASTANVHTIGGHMVGGIRER
jgi:simple sugar transport system ATP-binding protein